MEREDILRVLRAHPDNCYHCGHPLGTGRTEGRELIRHYGGLIPDEIVLTPVMFLKVQDVLCLSESWGTACLGGSQKRPLPMPHPADFPFYHSHLRAKKEKIL